MNVRRLSVFLLLIFVIAVAASVNYTPPEGPGNFKNLKILPKNISGDSLDLVMKQFGKALNVRCGFCHAMSKDTLPKKHLDFASDDKQEKGVARYMMQMTLDINKHYFTDPNSTRPDTIQDVTCITCHRGLADPTPQNIAKQMELLPKPGQVPPPPPPPGHKE